MELMQTHKIIHIQTAYNIINNNANPFFHI